MQRTPDDVDALASALYNISALRRELQRAAGIEHAVSMLTALGVLRRIGPVRISELAVELDLDLSVASRRIAGLESDGLVDRIADPADGRSSLVTVSERGLEKLQAVHAKIVESLAEAVEDWSSEEVTGLADGLIKLRTSLSASAERAQGSAAAETERTR